MQKFLEIASNTNKPECTYTCCIKKKYFYMFEIVQSWLIIKLTVYFLVFFRLKTALIKNSYAK